MFRLPVAAAERWLDLPHGVRIKVRPLSTAILEASRAQAARETRALQQEAEAAAAAGHPMDPRGRNGANAAWLSGLWAEIQVRALLDHAVIEWEGVEDEHGAPLGLTEAALAAFAAHPEMADAFFAAYRAPVEELAAEGNGSAS
jgi:hypothetical protein